jgi:hypothetical protein
MKEINFYSGNVPDQRKEIGNDEDYFINLVSQKYLNNEITITPMFSVPILHIKMSDWDNKKKQLLDIFYSGKDKLYNTKYVNTTYFDHSNEKYLSDEELKNLRTWEQYINESISDLLKEEKKIIYECFGNPTDYPNQTFLISSCWFQEQKKGMFHPAHTHGNCGLSGVCFINYDENEHTATRFLSPYINAGEQESDYYFPKDISSGSLIIFPSNIIHYTYPHDSEKSRLILSLNIKI